MIILTGTGGTLYLYTIVWKFGDCEHVFFPSHTHDVTNFS